MMLSTAVAISLETGDSKYELGNRVSLGNLFNGPFPHEEKEIKKMKKKDKDENEKIKEKFIKLNYKKEKK